MWWGAGNNYGGVNGIDLLMEWEYGWDGSNDGIEDIAEIMCERAWDGSDDGVG